MIKELLGKIPTSGTGSVFYASNQAMPFSIMPTGNLWHDYTSPYLIVQIIIWTIIFLIGVTFFTVLARRLYMGRRYRLLDAGRESYSRLTDLLAERKDIDIETYKKKVNSIEWQVIEEVLINALENPRCDKQQLLRYFDKLGYTEFYLDKLKSGKKWEQTLAANKLGTIRCKGAIPYLVSALKSEYRDLNNMAVYSLGIIGDENVIPHLVDRLKQSVKSDEEVSARIVKSSLISYREAAIPYLLRELENPVWQARSAVTDVLCELNTNEVALALMEKLHDPEQDVRAKAAKGLGKMRYRAAVPELLKLAEDPFWVVRLHATRSLGLIGEPSSIELIKERLKDKNWQVRKVAGEALGNIGGDAYPVLLDFFLNSHDQYAKEQAADELERNGIIRAAVMFLLAKKSAEDQDVLLKLVQILRGAGHEKAMSVVQYFAAAHFSPDEIREAVDRVFRDSNSP